MSFFKKDINLQRLQKLGERSLTFKLFLPNEMKVLALLSFKRVVKWLGELTHVKFLPCYNALPYLL